MTRIPELEQELVAAAARLRSPRRGLRPAARAALAGAAVVAMVVLVVVGAAENDDGDRRARPTSTPPSSQQGAKVGIDVQAGVRFSLQGRQLTISLFSWTPNDTHNRVAGARIRATCGETFTTTRDVWPTRTRFWPAGRETVRFRFARDISNSARWCRVEDPAVGHVAFVKFGSAPVRPLSATEKIERTANAWARLFAASDLANCDYMSQPACERIDCTRAGGAPIENCTPASRAFRRSFRAARVGEVAIQDERFGEGSQFRRAAVRFSNGRTILLIGVQEGTDGGGDWLIEKFQGNPGRMLFEK